MSQISVYVDTSEVLSELSDQELLREVEDRKLKGSDLQLEGEKREELVRAVVRKDWEEVDYLLRTYFLRQEIRNAPIPQVVARAVRA